MGTTRHRLGSILAAAAITLTTIGVAAPAQALDGPWTQPDEVTAYGRGVVAVDVAANDHWDPTLSVEVTAASVSWGYMTQVAQDLASTPVEPTVTPDPANPHRILVDFGAYDVDAPAGVRMARVPYTITDSAGQSADGYAMVYETNDPAAMSTADDDNASLQRPGGIDLTGQEYFDFDPTLNDTIGRQSEYDYEVVDAPVYGTVDPPNQYNGNWRYTPSEPAFASHQETFSYRLRLKSDPTVVSGVASVAFDVWKGATPVAPKPVYAGVYKGFYLGGPAAVTVDPGEILADEMAKEGRASEVPTGATYQVASNEPQFGTLDDNGDGTYTYTLTSKPTYDADGWLNKDMARFTAVDAFGSILGTVEVSMLYMEPGSGLHQQGRTPRLVDDEIWVGVGQEVPLYPYDNDDVQASYLPDYVDWVGLVTQDDWAWLEPRPRVVEQGTLGTMSVGGQAARGYTAGYAAGSVAGTDTVLYEQCLRYPVLVAEACSTTTVTVHVTPLADAVDDAVLASPGETVLVDPLGNDAWTDTPDIRAAVTAGDVPSGMTVVPDGRSLAVTVPADWEPGRVEEFRYTLTDYSGSDEASARVRVLPELVTISDPPPADPTDPVPPVDDDPTPVDPVDPVDPVPPVTEDPTEPVPPVTEDPTPDLTPTPRPIPIPVPLPVPTPIPVPDPTPAPVPRVIPVPRIDAGRAPVAPAVGIAAVAGPVDGAPGWPWLTLLTLAGGMGVILRKRATG